MKLAICTTVWRRPEVTAIWYAQLDRLRTLRDIELEVVICGSEHGTSEAPAQRARCHYIECANAPLPMKHNLGVLRAKRLNPDYVLSLDSDDLIGSSLFHEYVRLAESGVDYAGLKDVYVLEGRSGELAYWPGYVGKREGEPCGTGRLYSKALLDMLRWRPWSDKQTGPRSRTGLDWGVTAKVRASGVGLHLIELAANGWLCVDVKTEDNIYPYETLAAVECQRGYSLLEEHLGPTETMRLYELQRKG